MRISAWSSDVCSSDLLLAVFFVPPAGPTGAATVETLTDDLRISSLRELRTPEQVIEEQAPDASASATVTGARQARSGERRVGKASVCPCSSRWSPHPQKKKTQNIYLRERVVHK